MSRRHDLKKEEEEGEKSLCKEKKYVGSKEEEKKIESLILV